jgi:hypothetical protein
MIAMDEMRFFKRAGRFPQKITLGDPIAIKTVSLDISYDVGNLTA